MGGSTYNEHSRSVRASSMGYFSKSADDTFQQNRKREIHESMMPQKAKIREACDSETHPFTVPIILGLDVTGSMMDIPKMLIKNGLPTLMSNLIQKGVKDATLLFIAFGDHVYDKEPIQIGQFESGDEELDMWLTRTWLEGGGGGNDGESSFLSWYFAATHTKIDSFDKRGEKGFLITISDEPGLTNLPSSEITNLFEDQQVRNYSDKELLKMVSEKYNVYHIHVEHGSSSRRSAGGYWKDILGQNCIITNDYNEIPNIVANIVIDNSKDYAYVKGLENKPFTISPEIISSGDAPEIML
jgi:hypothetical protein